MQVELQGFANYRRPVSSPVLMWLPLFAGFIAAAIVASIICPVPRTQRISGVEALGISTAYVGITITAGVAALVCAYGVIRGQSAVRLRWVLLRFCGVTAWVAPTLVFYTRKSFWAVSTDVILAGIATRLIHSYYSEIKRPEPPPALANLLEHSMSPRLVAMVAAALCVQSAAACGIAGLARPASMLIGAAIALITWSHKAVAPETGSPANLPWRALRSFPAAVGFAIALTAAGLTPYLVVAGGWSPAQSTKAQSKPSGFQQSVRTFFGGFLNIKFQRQARESDAIERGMEELDPSAHSLLQILFGDETTASPAGSDVPRNTSSGKLASIVFGESYSGMILRPLFKDYVTIVPPLPQRRVFGGNPNEYKAEPVSIPFYGAYWFFRAPDKTLPSDALESQGDPALTSFRTTDFAPMAMEARQHFGRLIEMSCCRAIQVVIKNGDRRPNTVSLELILVNTRLTGRPRRSLGMVPVTSSLRWRPGDNRPAVTEVLTFVMPAQAGIRDFDEAIIRFELDSPRHTWSAKIAIDRFRLIPREL